jgi:hypothetical protein
VFQLDHLTSPSAGAEKTFTKSSAFSFFGSASSLELPDLAGVNVLRLRQFRQELFGYFC